MLGPIYFKIMFWTWSGGSKFIDFQIICACLPHNIYKICFVIWVSRFPLAIRYDIIISSQDFFSKNPNWLRRGFLWKTTNLYFRGRVDFSGNPNKEENVKERLKIYLIVFQLKKKNISKVWMESDLHELLWEEGTIFLQHGEGTQLWKWRGCSDSNSKVGVFRWEIFLQKRGSFSEETQKCGQTVRIRQILANFQAKIQIWAHFGQQFRKKIENFDYILSKKELFGEILSKTGYLLLKKGGSWGRARREKGGQWVRASWKGGWINVATHPSHQF